MKSLTIQLPDDVEQRLREVSEREKRSVEDTAGAILQQRLRADRFRDLCRESESLARAAGFGSEDEVLRAIS